MQRGILMMLSTDRGEFPETHRSPQELPRLRSGFRRAAQTPRKRLNFDYVVVRFANDNSAQDDKGVRPWMAQRVSVYVRTTISCDPVEREPSESSPAEPALSDPEPREGESKGAE
jgi:hypothetical protein